ncbi:MAG: DNA-processing protein DprA [Pirellulales bacterium]
MAELLASWKTRNVDLLIEGTDDYPSPLAEIPDPPGMLFRRGELLPADRMSVAIVGTRHCSQYGIRMAERLAAGLVKSGYTVVSGLARGIDAAAHQSALKAGGRTIAVLGSGVIDVYPTEHKPLAERVIASGCLLSETPPDGRVEKGAFPRRNRIISGLTLGTIVVEAGLKSGSLITARHAMEQGREVFAVPGHADEETARGCHRLIRDGAKLVESIDDVLEELGPLPTPTPTADGTIIRNPIELQLNDVECAILDLIRTDATGVDGVIVGSGLPVQQVLATLSVLEMKRLIRRLSGQLVQRR